ncbi:hypothetical protein [Thermococcus sp.]|uniref:hypothetical protein n=1 Tax=Thermococcus sp. TaxID=35749 RepID=UPI00260A9374|nr:hypothetical protein [Thermococcus sp.]
MVQPVLINPLIVVALIVLTTFLGFLAILGLGLGGTLVKGRLPGDGAFYLLYGTITKLGYTKDVVGNILRLKIGKSKLSFIVNPEHRTYLYGKPLYILSIEYGTSIHPSMLAILTALKEMGRDEMIKDYLELNYAYNSLANALEAVTDDKKREEMEQTLKQLEQAIRTKEQELRAFVDKNAQVVEVKQNLSLEDLKTDKQVLVVRTVDPALIGEYTNAVSAPKLSANMDLYALHMSSIFKSDVVKVAFAAMLILIGVGVVYMLLHGQSPPQVNVKITPETLKHLANSTAEVAKNSTVVKI